MSRAVRSRVHSVAGSYSRRVGVLCYHQVGPTEVDPWDIAVTPDHFDQQLELMAERGRLVGLADAVRARRSDRIGTKQPMFAVTFDDGYLDNLTTALPALERHHAPVTVFISTSFLDTDSFWWDRIAALTLGDDRSVCDTAAAAMSVGLFDEQLLADVDTWTQAKLHDELYEAIRRHPDIDGALDALDAELPGAARPHQRPMTADELVEFAAHPLVNIGAHTVSHRSLTSIDAAAIDFEIRAGLDRLHEILGKRPEMFAYPFGHAGRRERRIVESLGLSHAFTTAERWISPLDRRHELPRLNPTNLGREAFGRWLTG